MPIARRWGKKAVEDTCALQTAACSSNHPSAESKPSILSRTRELPHPCRWYENRENHEAALSLEDVLPLPALAPAAIEYRHCLRAIWMCKEGRTTADVSKELGRPEGWVTRCRNLKIDEVKRPKEVAKYISEYETRMLRDGIEPFRQPSIRRKYMDDCAGMYEECVAAMPWRQAVLRKRNYQTGEVTITNIASNRQDCTFPSLRTGIARLDAVLQKVKAEYHIHDPGAYLICNWYPDGSTNIAPHQHDFWSAILSFGASRVFTLDWQPLLLGEGDLLVFGTQRHSVPKMPLVKEGRVSVAIFWYPERRKADASFSISLDPASAEAALAHGSLSKALGNAAVEQLKNINLDVSGRGVGRYENEGYFLDADEEEDADYLPEERLIEIALQLSMLEQ